MRKNRLFLFVSLFLPLVAFSQTIKEKKESLLKNSGQDQDSFTSNELKLINRELQDRYEELTSLYQKGLELYNSHADLGEYEKLTSQIARVKVEINEINEMWRKEVAVQESYALWNQPEATLIQLIMDYGAQEFVYIVPPEIASIPLSINSNLPIPRESWAECLAFLLSQNGVGVRELNPYLRELYLFSQDASPIKCMTNQIRDLELFPGNTRICYILSLNTMDPHSAIGFLQKFSNPKITSLEIIRGEIFIISTVDAIKELLKLHEFACGGSRTQEYQLVSLTKIDAEEMKSLLESAFHTAKSQSGGLEVLALKSLKHSLFLFGTKEEVKKAIALIREVEGQILDAKEKTVFWYTVKHSEAEELATVLAKVYDLLIGGGVITETDLQLPKPKQASAPSQSSETPPVTEIKSDLVVEPQTIKPKDNRTSHRTGDGKNNFIVDAKSGSIIMVVQQEALPKIKELLKKLDVPKKMVEIEVLLFEKKITNQNKLGLNLLKIGNQTASNTNQTGFSWNKLGAGITEFLISRAKGSSIPAFDLAYHFLLGQEDVQINASPSITTVNQTPAKIAIVEEISINTGTDFEKEKNKNAYSRAQYGITIQITPTINVGGDEEEEKEKGFITLDTDITFDTTKKTQNDRPDVTRRHIKNHVRIADGETVILGGLRRKSMEDSKEGIPFLGEIPGIGKLFSMTDMNDSSTEMFVFITPKIISDPIHDAERIRVSELSKRPGDLPQFVQELVQAKDKEKKRLFENSLNALFGRNEGAFTLRDKGLLEYDGKS